MNVLVTGATGLVGSHVVRAVEAGGHEVRALVRRRSDVRALAGTTADRVIGDITSEQAMLSACEGVDVVIHCAAVFSYWGWSAEELARINVDGTRTVLEAAGAAGVRRAVVTSSSITLGSSAGPVARDEGAVPGPDEPSPDYFVSKLQQERAAADVAARIGIELVLANPTIVVGGPDYRLVPSNALITRYLADPMRTTFPGGCNIVSVRDVAAGLVLLADAGAAGTRYVLGGENWSWPTIHRVVSELCGTWGPGLTATRTAAYLGSGVQELIARLLATTPAATRAEARTVGRYFWYRHDRAAGLGYRPRPARQALAEALGWLLTSEHVPQPVRDWLRPLPDVYESRKLIPSSGRR
ncbi:MAG: NAD-dependent epimerase/dehydratase family protein [Actinomycetes bacterium]